MSDPRFAITPIFDKRKEEWNPDKILDYVSRLFQSIRNLEGWEFISAGWSNGGHVKKEELKRNILKALVVKIRNPKQEELSYIIQVPELINDQYFFIGGYTKLPMLQLYDPPVIYRKEILKLRTNTISLGMDLKKGYNVSIFGKNIPIDLLICNVHTPEELEEFMNISVDETNNAIVDNIAMQAILEKCTETWGSKTPEELVYLLGNYFSTNDGDQIKKGTSAIFSIRMTYEVDIFSQEQFQTKSLLFELLKAIHDGVRSDTDVTKKYIRFTQYILSPLIRKIYDMLLSIKNNPRTKFQIPQSVLYDICNQSDIVRFSFPYNPVMEVSQLCQCTLTGPGGFKKDNVPGHLRNLDPSQFGLICPADTPDRSGCGVTVNLIPTIDIQSNNTLGQPSKEIVTSYPITLTPFMEHDDQTRLQMAASQAKQSILLKNSQKPFIRSGTEGLYHENTSFLQRAKSDGHVVYNNSNNMVVKYEEIGKSDIFDIGHRIIYQNVLDLIEPKFVEGDNFKEGDILCESKFLKDGELSLGQNLLCGVAVYEGFNYEDGIVISRSVAESRFTSLHYVDLTFNIDPSQVLLSLKDGCYEPLPKIGDIIKKGDPYAKIKMINGDDGFESINVEPTELYSPLNCKIVGVEIYPNFWNKKVNEYNTFIGEMIMAQSESFAMIDNKLNDVLTTDEVDIALKAHNLNKLDCVHKKGNYSFKGQKLKGIRITLKAVFEESIGIGDKIANRHGNKGIIALIEEDELMPTTPDGRKLDIVVNPMGIISRMNCGQLFELHMSEALYHLKNKLKEIFNDVGIEETVNHLKGFLDIIDRTPEKWVTAEILEKFEVDLKTKTSDEAIENLYLIQPSFQSVDPHGLKAVMEYTGAQYKYPVFYPGGNVMIENPISVGYVYFTKLIHRASDKMSARSIGPYSKKTLQPLGGKSQLGGHKLGEMEIWSIMAHGATDLLNDFLTTQSDSPGLKNKLLAGILDNPELAAAADDEDMKPQSLRLFESCLKVMGLEMKN